MREITNKTELAEFFRDTLLPYYEKHYREDLTFDNAERLGLDCGLCFCAKWQFSVNIYDIMGLKIVGAGYLIQETMEYEYTAKESLLPRIEWMRKFIKENIV